MTQTSLSSQERGEGEEPGLHLDYSIWIYINICMWTRCPYTHCCQWLIRIWLSCHEVMSSVLLVALGYLRHLHRIVWDDPWPLPFWISSRRQGKSPHGSKIMPDTGIRELNLFLGSWIWPLFSKVHHLPLGMEGLHIHSSGSPKYPARPNAYYLSVAELKWGLHNRQQEYSTMSLQNMT